MVEALCSARTKQRRVRPVYEICWANWLAWRHLISSDATCVGQPSPRRCIVLECPIISQALAETVHIPHTTQPWRRAEIVTPRVACPVKRWVVGVLV